MTLAKEKMMGEVTGEQARALIRFADDNGHYWKSKLRICWERSAYPMPRARVDAGLLQQVRNRLGPSWLHKIRTSDLLDLSVVSHVLED